MSDILKKVSKKSMDHEFYTPYPQGYKKGKTKYVVVLGTVMSGLGKGILGSSLGKLLQYKGFKIAPIKFDGYLNQDAGTLNPFRHGEVFVLDDGTESDNEFSRNNHTGGEAQGKSRAGRRRPGDAGQYDYQT